MTQNDQKDKVKEPLAVEDQGPFVHVLRLHLTNGETFNLQESRTRAMCLRMWSPSSMHGVK